MRKLFYITFIGMLVPLLVPTSAWSMIASNVSQNPVLETEAEGIHVFFGTSMHTENGDMTYTIQGPEDGGWKSELEWPLDGIIYLGGTVSVSFLERLQLNAGVWKSLTEDAGDMKDSDWLFAFFGDTKVIYSESESTVDSMQFDVNFRCDFFENETLLFGALLGYSQTKWEWDAGNGYQETILPGVFYQGPIEGIGITYEEELKVPYLGIALSIFPSNSALGMNIYTLYSPKARCDDEDDHILRYKLSTGDTEGTFLSVGSDIRWQFTNSLSLTGKINYSSYDLTGEQQQLFYYDDPNDPDDPPAGTGFSGIDLSIEGSQVYFGLMLGYEF